MEELAERIRTLLDDEPHISEKKMFGGVCFMLNGNMLCGPTNKGQLMVRVGKELEAEAMSRPGARPMDFTGKPMRGFVFVESSEIAKDETLREWIALAKRFVGTLPAK